MKVKIVKKLLAFVILLVIVLSLSACVGTVNSNDTQNENQAQDTFGSKKSDIIDITPAVDEPVFDDVFKYKTIEEVLASQPTNLRDYQCIYIMKADGFYPIYSSLIDDPFGFSGWFVVGSDVELGDLPTVNRSAGEKLVIICREDYNVIQNGDFSSRETITVNNLDGPLRGLPIIWKGGQPYHSLIDYIELPSAVNEINGIDLSKIDLNTYAEKYDVQQYIEEEQRTYIALSESGYSVEPIADRYTEETYAIVTAFSPDDKFESREDFIKKTNKSITLGTYLGTNYSESTYSMDYNIYVCDQTIDCSIIRTKNGYYEIDISALSSDWPYMFDRCIVMIK